MDPIRIEYDIGSTLYGQPLSLIRSKNSAGQWEWTLHRGQADQRDDSTFIAGLTKDHLLKLAEAVKTEAK